MFFYSSISENILRDFCQSRTSGFLVDPPCFLHRTTPEVEVFMGNALPMFYFLRAGLNH